MIVLVDIFKEIADCMKINFEAGRGYQIVTGLVEKDNSRNYRDKKYPLLALFMPIQENRGSGFYAQVRIPKIVIATLTIGTDPILKRYESDGTFKKILYPAYEEFLKQLAKHKNISGQDPDAFFHAKFDNPATAPIDDANSDYVDAIEIQNLELTLINIKTCKNVSIN